ncbi:peptidase domain-containing ABC transporter [Flammeovirga sp. OC4]|uniref:peptidase domain-containing ABC transporter n=1 Tax=Flammeovirga sp. OC4 TaxID=1382345 RepID=UPI0009E1FE5D|nr:peptidase domain-containing ABC transporter [Flammeovirga sp. OC4]
MSIFNTIPEIKQPDLMDCGPTCLKIIAQYYGRKYPISYLRDLTNVNREGTSLLELSDAAEEIGFHTVGVKISLKQLKETLLPGIVHWEQSHFIVVYKITKKKVFVVDPMVGKVVYSLVDFCKGWTGQKSTQSTGIALLLEPTVEFMKKEYEKESINKKSLSILFDYIKPYHRFIIQLFIGLFVGSVIQLILPFLTQSIIDIGINNQRISFIYLILFAQLTLFFSQSSIDFIRRWILLHLSIRVNIAIISDFLVKLTQLPLSFFDSKLIGDLLQRIDDHERVESFLSSSTLNMLFSIFNFIIFSIVLVYYNITLFLVFSIGSTFYILYLLLFLKIRKEIDYKRFGLLSKKQSNTIQLINGMQEIKLNGCEKQKRWEWEGIQASAFRLTLKSTSIDQYQQIGSMFINEFKNILITFIAAKSVIDGNMTLGMMLSAQYIIGQMNGPIQSFVSFIKEWQDAKLSMDRIGDIHNKENEEKENSLKDIPFNESLIFENVDFRYNSTSELILKNLSFIIPKNKTTAIVGSSGSGKTTILKLLLKFYGVENGSISFGNNNIENLSERVWRAKCGTVMQEGYIFSDTIEKNISIADSDINYNKLYHSAKMANIHEFILSLPLGYKSKIGEDGIGISAGQKQRILIARAIYKNPDYLFFDEATSALDANNEAIITENLNKFMKGKTSVVIAHRLSTVKNADQIIVLDKGEIIEIGTHEELTQKEGFYFSLVKNQLELGA